MIIKKLSVKGFGKLKNIDINLTPGFNIVYGENEAGKSTLQAFIKGVFYGLDKKTKINEIGEYERYRPWNSEEFAGMIEYEVEGFTYKVGRNFITNKVSLCNEFWDDISNQFPIDKKKGPLFAEQHIGLSEECFERTIFVRQLESKFKDSNRVLVDKLINIQQTGQEDISFKEAVQVLENAIREKIGSSKTKKKPLNDIDNKIEELLKEKSEIVKLRNEILGLEERIKQKQIEREELIRKIEYNKNLKQLIKKEDLIQIYNKAKDYENTIESIENELKRLEPFRSFPIHLEDRLKEILIQIKSYTNALADKEEYIRQIESRIELIERENERNQDADTQNIYAAASEFEVLKRATQEKEEYELKLNELTSQLNNLRFKLKEYDTVIINNAVLNVDYERQQDLDNKINELNKIKTEIEKVNEQSKSIKADMDTDISLYDIEQAISNYKRLAYLKEELLSIQLEVQRIEQGILKNNAVLYDLQGFSKLPDDIENKVIELQNKARSNMHVVQKMDNLLIEQRYFKFKFVLNIILLTLTLGFFGYGTYIMLLGFNPLAYLFAGLGLITCAFSIMGFININILNNVGKDETNEELMQIYKSAGVKDFNSFIKNLYEFKDASDKSNLLNVELKAKKEQLSSVTQKIEKLEKELSCILNLFNINHKTGQINDRHIEDLERQFIDKVDSQKLNVIESIREKRQKLLYELIKVSDSERVTLEDIEVIYNNLVEEKEKIKIKQNEIVNDEIEFKKREIEQIKDIIQKFEEKVISSDKKIKSILKLYSVEYGDNIVTEKEIDSLKDTFNKLFKESSELNSLKTIKNNITEEISKLNQEKIKLEKEKEEILEKAMVLDENQFFEGCSKCKKFKELVEEKKRVIKVYNDILNGENSKTILEKVSSIRGVNISEDIRNKSIESIDSDLEKLNEELKNVEKSIISLKSEASNKLKGRMDLNQIVESIEALQEEKNKLEEKKRALEVAIEVIKEASQQIQRDFAPKFQKEMSSIIRKITNNRYSEIKTNEKLNINVITPDTGQIVEVDKLSVGTVEQFYLALRIALSNLLSKGEKLPLIIDEAFVQYDDNRTKNIIEFLLDESKDRQIIIFTCQRREIDIIRNLGKLKNINLIELKV